MIVGRPHLHHHRAVGSTNDEARRLAGSGAPSGTVVTSDSQSGGRGRQGRPWSSPAGALAYSLVLRRKVEVPGTLPLQAGVAVCEAVESLNPLVQAEVKWPNDIWIDGRKVAGILVEARPQDGWAVIGIGLNVCVSPDDFPEEVRERATSVGGGADVPAAIRAMNAALGYRLDSPLEETLAGFSRRDALRGRPVSWQEGSGTAAGIDREGNLLVESPVGCLTALNAGEVHLDADTD